MTSLILAAALASIPVTSAPKGMAAPRVAPSAPAPVRVVSAPIPPDSLVLLFPSNVDTLSQEQRKAVKRLRARKAHVTGYADVWGEAAYNKAVSERRARAVAELIPGATYEGAGETKAFGKENRRAVVRTK